MKSKKCQMIIMIVLMGIFVSGGISFVVQQEEKLKHSETVDDVAPLSSEDPHPLYQEISYYQELIEWVDECVRTKGQNAEGLPEDLLPSVNFRYAQREKEYQIMGYLIQDINWDGVDELILGYNAVNETSTWRGGIYNVYTMIDGSPVRVLEGDVRYIYRLCEGGVLKQCCSSDCFTYGDSYFRMVDGQLELIETVMEVNRVEGEDDTLKWYYSDEGMYDTNCHIDGAFSEISEAEADEINGKYREIKLEFIPFGT